jgi:hypothetical protein
VLGTVDSVADFATCVEDCGAESDCTAAVYQLSTQICTLVGSYSDFSPLLDDDFDYALKYTGTS